LAYFSATSFFCSYDRPSPGVLWTFIISSAGAWPVPTDDAPFVGDVSPSGQVECVVSTATVFGKCRVRGSYKEGMICKVMIKCLEEDGGSMHILLQYPFYMSRRKYGHPTDDTCHVEAMDILRRAISVR
jgi:hypothetical protein